MTADRRGGKAKTEETPDERKSDRDMNEVQKKTFQPFLLELKKGKLHIQILYCTLPQFQPKEGEVKSASTSRGSQVDQSLMLPLILLLLHRLNLLAKVQTF